MAIDVISNARTLPTNTLLNIGLDSVSSDLVLICPACSDVSFRVGFDGLPTINKEKIGGRVGIDSLIKQLNLAPESALVIPIYKYDQDNKNSSQILSTNLFQSCQSPSSIDLSLSFEELQKIQTHDQKSKLEFKDADGNVKTVHVKFKYKDKILIQINDEVII